MIAKRLAGRVGLLSIATFLLAKGAFAQSGRPWVDPPRPGEASREAAPPAPPAAAQPEPPLTRPQPPRIDIPAEPQRPSQAESAPQSGQADPSPPLLQGAAPPTDNEGSQGAAPAPTTRSAEPPRITFPGPDEPPAPTQRRSRSSDFAGAAEKLAIAYLSYWSAPNAVALDATPDFYAPQVLFHGRQMSARALFEEKRRFVRRWPVREYSPRSDTMRTSCDPAPPICTVRTVFDFTAANPHTGRRSQGTAHLQLGVSFADGEPMIVFETSQVISRGPSASSKAFEDDDDDRY